VVDAGAAVGEVFDDFTVATTSDFYETPPEPNAAPIAPITINTAAIAPMTIHLLIDFDSPPAAGTVPANGGGGNTGGAPPES
jgi:hypothetical protein